MKQRRELDQKSEKSKKMKLEKHHEKRGKPWKTRKERESYSISAENHFNRTFPQVEMNAPFQHRPLSCRISAKASVLTCVLTISSLVPMFQHIGSHHVTVAGSLDKA